MDRKDRWIEKIDGWKGQMDRKDRWIERIDGQKGQMDRKDRQIERIDGQKGQIDRKDRVAYYRLYNVQDFCQNPDIKSPDTDTQSSHTHKHSPVTYTFYTTYIRTQFSNTHGLYNRHTAYFTYTQYIQQIHTHRLDYRHTHIKQKNTHRVRQQTNTEHIKQAHSLFNRRKETCRQYRYLEVDGNTKRHVDSIDMQKQKEIQSDMQTVQTCRSRKKYKEICRQ